MAERTRAAAARADRTGESVQLVAVTKNASVAESRALFDLGQRHLGENRIQAALPKMDELGAGPVWHLVGHLQRNKVRKAVERFVWIHSVDSQELLERINRVAGEIGVPPPQVCLQVNVTDEEAKHGLRPEAIRPLLGIAARMAAVNVVGLMTMARYDPDPETARPAFRTLSALRDDADRGNWYHVPLPHLSMGMSDDFEVAVEEGATLVRVGSALFSSVLS